MTTITAGTAFAGYSIERLLGTGGMGEVYLAKHPHLDKHDALKLMSDGLLHNDEYRQRFLNESDIACRVQHENVVQVYDRGDDNGRLWIAMQYVPGQDLAELITSQGPLPPERAVNILHQIASALDAVHGAGLLHRDVKPGNVLLTTDLLGRDRAYLTDFGIARYAADGLGLTQTGDVVATFLYASPEQCTGEVQLDQRVDVYALGVVFYQMLTGHVPYQASSVAPLFKAILEQPPPRPSAEVPSVPAALDRVIARAMAKDRTQRFSSCGDLAAAAEAAIAQTEFEKRPEPSTPSQPRTELTHTPPPPYRITRTEFGPTGQQVDGPFDTATMPPFDSQQLVGLVQARGFFNLPPQFGDQAVGYGTTTISVTSPTAAHEVRWHGPCPPALADLDAALVRLRQHRSMRWWIPAMAAALVLVIGGVVVGALLLTGGSGKPLPPPPLTAPVGVNSVAGPGEVTLTWQPVLGATGYALFRDGARSGGDILGTSYRDALPDVRKHNYEVSSINRVGVLSPRSPVATATAGLRALNSDETSLVASFPSGLVRPDSCTPGTTAAGDYDLTTHPQFSASVACDYDTSHIPADVDASALRLYVQQYRTSAGYSSDLTGFTSGIPTGTCASSRSEQTTWTIGNATVGKLFCESNSTDGSWLSWSYDDKRVIMTIFGKAASDIPALLKIWNAAPSLTLS